MMQFISTLIISSFLIVFTACGQEKSSSTTLKSKNSESDKIVKSEDEWKALLTAEEYEVLRLKGTELAFTGEYNFNREKGIYLCAACGNELFSSKTKYNSGSGWPSFYQPLNVNAVGLESDESLGVTRTEVVCNRCGGHLGHVFNDGPKPTGLRYCVNSVSLDFKKE